MKTLDVVQIFGNIKIDIETTSIPPFSDLISLWQEVLTKRKNKLGSIKSFFIDIGFKKAAAEII
jgi:hypothetical protein